MILKIVSDAWMALLWSPAFEGAYRFDGIKLQWPSHLLRFLLLLSVTDFSASAAPMPEVLWWLHADWTTLPVGKSLTDAERDLICLDEGECGCEYSVIESTETDVATHILPTGPGRPTADTLWERRSPMSASLVHPLLCERKSVTSSVPSKRFCPHRSCLAMRGCLVRNGKSCTIIQRNWKHTSSHRRYTEWRCSGSVRSKERPGYV